MTTLLVTAALALAPMLAPAPAEALYLLGYGDTIVVTVKDAPQYQATGIIRPDGVVTIPFLGDIEVAGLTPTQVEDRIARALKAVLRSPQVSVTVTGFKPMRVILLGQVTQPGVKEISRPSPTLFDVLGEAGGLTDRAVAAEVVVLRGNGPSAERFTVDVEKMLKQGDFTNNPVIKDGDRIMVKEVWWPNWEAIRNNLTITLGTITAIAALLALYDRASQPSR